MEWVQIKDFPRYYVNTMGNVLDSERDMVVRPNKVTGGALIVHMKGPDGQYHNRSLKILIAEAFVPYDFDVEERDVSTFDTSILLDNNPENVFASNIRWRPRWFAWKYAHQFHEIIPEYHKGPLKCFQNDLLFRDVMHVGIYYGLLFDHVYESARAFEDHSLYRDRYSWADMDKMPPYVWPLRKCFGFID